ncbi:MAG: site-specific DNA-methyltransferase [Paludibacteraceae bacterium]|nr:site-specific DNA-methyltransferase [Paludibacteraceae bacterium]
MPTLNWIGKDKVINHHLDVPFHTLDKQYTVGDSDSGNKIINGDNLVALKALLPEYEGKIKCIYIDPPYNTGNEGWIYNDNVNAPQIKRWLGQVVGKEGEDLSRHDKWLCMMYPRLQLLHKLLADDGAIFISIDDNEQANLKLLCDEIFGERNFVANIPWRKRTAKSDVPHGLSQDCESILCYSKTSIFCVGIEKDNRKYFTTKDYPEKPWRYHDLTKQTTIEERPNSNFSIINPKTNEEYPVNPLRSWAITKDTFEKYYNENRIIFPGDYDFLKITKPVLRYWKEEDEIKAGEKFGMSSVSTFLPNEVGMTQDGTKEITSIFGEKKFNFPKPSSLIYYILQIASDKSSIILDSFAGSGTTAHAVLNLNKKDGGNRKFILVEMEDYAETITAERVKRVINGYGEGDKAVEGTGGGFDYFSLGKTIFNTDGNLNEDVGVEKIREYIWYSETGTSLSSHSNDYFLGSYNATDYYFYYEQNEETILTRENIGTIIKQKAESYIIYADACQIEKKFMETNNIAFKRIPRDIKKL